MSKFIVGDGAIQNQKDLFESEWRKRSHRCRVCNKPLPVYSHYYCAHVLGKNAFPLFKLASFNIWILCYDCHSLYDDDTGYAKTLPMFKELFEYRQSLKELYEKIA